MFYILKSFEDGILLKSTQGVSIFKRFHVCVGGGGLCMHACVHTCVIMSMTLTDIIKENRSHVCPLTTSTVKAYAGIRTRVRALNFHLCVPGSSPNIGMWDCQGYQVGKGGLEKV